MSTDEKEKQKRNDVEWVLSTEQGRRFMFNLLGHCGLYRSQEGDSEARTIQEGARRVGLHLLGSITEVDELLYVKMQVEARNRNIQEIFNERSSDTDTSDSTSTSSRSDAEYDSATGGYDSGDTLPEYEFGLGATFL